MMWAVGIGMYLAIVAIVWLNEDRFNERWLDLGAGSWFTHEEEKPVSGYVAYTVSYPRADISDLWR